MVKFQIASDLHIEYKKHNIPNPFLYIHPSAENLILAGDIGSFYKLDQLVGFLTIISKQFNNVFYIPGNHEYYTQEGYPPLPITELDSNFLNAINHIDNLHFLNRDTYILDDVYIIGCTLWSDLKIQLPPFVRMYDVSTNTYTKNYNDCVSFIKTSCQYAIQHNLKPVVITHYPPSYRVCSDRYTDDTYKSLYFSNLDNILQDYPIKFWVYGHTHYNLNTNIHNTHVITNQCGKFKSNYCPKSFKKNFITCI